MDTTALPSCILILEPLIIRHYNKLYTYICIDYPHKIRIVQPSNITTYLYIVNEEKGSQKWKSWELFWRRYAPSSYMYDPTKLFHRFSSS